MVVEDDPHYARVLVNLAKERGFKVLLARTGADALIFARKYPLAAVSLDVFLPDMLGWTVLNQLKRSSETRHIPVQVLTVEDERQYGLERGAFAFLTKTGTTEELETALDRLMNFTQTQSAAPAGGRGRSGRADERDGASGSYGYRDPDRDHRRRSAGEPCARRQSIAWYSICGCRTCPDLSCWSRSSPMRRCGGCRSSCSPGRDISDAEESQLKKSAKSIVLKGVRSPERLLDETALFLHRVVADLPPAKQAMLQALHEGDEPLTGRKVLVVDDDIRNIFALNSLLERHHMSVITATNGQEAIKLVESTEDLSLVLMDVMMPEMDGYETMRRIRQQSEVQDAAHHRADGQGHEGRSRKVPGGRGFGLCGEAGQYRSAALTGASVAAPLDQTPSPRRTPAPR